MSYIPKAVVVNALDRQGLAWVHADMIAVHNYLNGPRTCADWDGLDGYITALVDAVEKKVDTSVTRLFRQSGVAYS